MNGFTSCCILLSANTEASTCLWFHTRGSRCSIFLCHHLVFLSRNWCNRGSNNYMSIFSMFFLTCTISHVLAINRDYCMLPFLFQPGRYNIFICYNFFCNMNFFCFDWNTMTAMNSITNSSVFFCFWTFPFRFHQTFSTNNNNII